MFEKLAMMFPLTILGMDTERVTPLTRDERKNSKVQLEIQFTRDERKNSRVQLEIQSHIEKNNRTLKEEYELVKLKRSFLSFRCREFIINHFNNK